MIQAQRELRTLASPKRKAGNERFFKTGFGEYGHGDQFIGVSVPENRRIARRFSDLSFRDLEVLLRSPVHEDRILALLILRPRFERARKKGDRALEEAVFRFYLQNRHRVNNWDLVDLSAPYISGPFIFDRRSERKTILGLADSKSMWDRRIAMLSTFYFIREGRFQETLALAKKYLTDPEDLMHKATGWMLREVGKRDLEALRSFLDRYGPKMPRTMLRYAIEKMSQKERLAWMAGSK
jgi:3-methyladenine DNA glycosylase AlkD